MMTPGPVPRPQTTATTTAVASSVTITMPATDALEFDGASFATLGSQGLTDQPGTEMWVPDERL